MSDGTHIEWTDATWNPITGCSVVSPGCTNCYAMKLAGTRLRDHPSRAGLTIDSKAGPVWNGEVRFNQQWLNQPLRWRRPRRIFVCAHGDLFHKDVPFDWIDQVFAIMALAPEHTFQVLTKRPKKMQKYLDHERRGPIYDYAELFSALSTGHPSIGTGVWPLPNVWLGVSVEDQKHADERIPVLLDTPAAVRWISAEPLLGHIDLTRIPMPQDEGRHSSALVGNEIAGMLGNCVGWIPPLDWVVVGGESGQGARPMHPDWARSLRDQCAESGVPFLFKQWGEYGPCELVPPGSAELSVIGAAGRHMIGAEAIWGDPSDERAEIIAKIGKKAAGRVLDSVQHNGYPAVSS